MKPNNITLRDFPTTLFRHCVLLALAFPALAFAQTPAPEWIWHDNQGRAPADQEVRFFRKTFTLPGPVRRAMLTASGDDQMIAFINGRQVAINDGWNKAITVNVTKDLREGENLIAARGKNNSGDAAFIARLEVTFRDGAMRTIVTDTTWLSSAQEAAGWEQPAFAASGWTKPVSRGKLGVQPWGNVMAAPAATAANKLRVADGFKVELIHSASREEGSWICLAVDPKGRLIISPQGDRQRLLRVTLGQGGKVASLERIEQPVWTAMGLLHAFDSLYVSGNGSKGLGLYRLRDTDGDDAYDQLDFLKKFDGAAGEHGSHALVLGPDKKIYYIHGNFVKVPADVAPDSPVRNYAEDQLLPRQEDGNGFGVGIKPPGSFVLRMDPDAKDCELFAAGMRNAYDLDFSPDGELFTFDSDMEWDWGTPWYRPTRVYHVVSGGDYGFREGTGKFPRHYPDTLPPVVDIGIGSPTGVKFGTKSKFPPKYQRALYIMDWSYGRIMAVHLTPDGATYSGTFENFVAPLPPKPGEPKPTLNVADLEFGRDGAMYFITGGRGTQSGLYRVSAVKNAVSASAKPEVAAGAAEARALRRKLEAFHGRTEPAAVDSAWPHLDHPDRFVRYAARVAIESQPVEQWQNRALAERRVRASLTALLALARLGSPAVQEPLLESLRPLWHGNLTEDQQLEALRIAALAFIRLGAPGSDVVAEIAPPLDRIYPASSERLNRELSQLLIYLQAPDVVPKTLRLLDAASTQEDQLHYIFHLRTLKTGWTLADRKTYFSWFNRDRATRRHAPEVVQWFKDVGRDYSDGASFPKFMANIRKDATNSVPEADRLALGTLLTGRTIAKVEVEPRSFVKDWAFDELAPLLEQTGKGRSFDRGKEAFVAAQCLACHRFGNDGGDVGPDLTTVSSRFTRRDILESIIDPSKVVSEQYQNITVTKHDGDDVTGRLIEETDAKLVLVTNPLTGDKTEVARKEIARREASKVSPMPQGLVSVLSREEILDLIAYLESSGKKDHAAFRKE